MRQKGKKDMEEDGIQEGMKIDMTTIGKDKDIRKTKRNSTRRNKTSKSKNGRRSSQNNSRNEREKEGEKERGKYEINPKGRVGWDKGTM